MGFLINKITGNGTAQVAITNDVTLEAVVNSLVANNATNGVLAFSLLVNDEVIFNETVAANSTFRIPDKVNLGAGSVLKINADTGLDVTVSYLQQAIDDAAALNLAQQAAQYASDNADRAENALPAGTIDDTVTTTDKAWSSTKITSELTNVGSEFTDVKKIPASSDGLLYLIDDTQQVNMAVVWLTSTKAIMSYQDAGDSGKQKAMLLTIDSNNTITPSTILEIDAGTTAYSKMDKIDANNVAITYRVSDAAYVVVVNENGGVLTKGTAVMLDNTEQGSPTTITVLSPTLLVISYSTYDPDGSYIVSVTIDNMTLTVNTRLQVYAGTQYSYVKKVTSTKLICVHYNGSDYVPAVVNVSGDTLVKEADAAMSGGFYGSTYRDPIVVISPTKFLLTVTMDAYVCSLNGDDTITELSRNKYIFGSNGRYDNAWYVGSLFIRDASTLIGIVSDTVTSDVYYVNIDISNDNIFTTNWADAYVHSGAAHNIVTARLENKILAIVPKVNSITNTVAFIGDFK